METLTPTSFISLPLHTISIISSIISLMNSIPLFMMLIKLDKSLWTNILTYFKVQHIAFPLSNLQELITQSIEDLPNQLLTATPDAAKILQAINSMNGNESPGLNGMSPLFSSNSRVLLVETSSIVCKVFLEPYLLGIDPQESCCKQSRTFQANCVMQCDIQSCH